MSGASSDENEQRNREIWEGFLGRGNDREALESMPVSGWRRMRLAGPGHVGLCMPARELGPSPGGTGEPERAWQPESSTVGPEIPPAAHGG